MASLRDIGQLLRDAEEWDGLSDVEREYAVFEQDGMDDEDEEGGQLQLPSTRRAKGWRALLDTGSHAATAVETRKRKRESVRQMNEKAEAAVAQAEEAKAKVGAAAEAVKAGTTPTIDKASLDAANDAAFAAKESTRSAVLAALGPSAPLPVAEFKEGMSEALRRCSNPAALAISTLESSKPTMLMQHYEPDWVRSFDPALVASRVRPLRYSGISIRDPHVSTDESPDYTDLQFRIDVGPGSVQQALTAAVPGSGQEPVIIEIPPSILTVTGRLGVSSTCKP